MKTVIMTLSAAVLVAAAPAVLARNAPHQHHQVFKKRPQVVYGYAPWQANSVRTSYGTSGYAPSAPKDYTYDNSRNAGGGGGGGSGM